MTFILRAKACSIIWRQAQIAIIEGIVKRDDGGLVTEYIAYKALCTGFRIFAANRRDNDIAASMDKGLIVNYANANLPLFFI